MTIRIPVSNGEIFGYLRKFSENVRKVCGVLIIQLAENGRKSSRRSRKSSENGVIGTFMKSYKITHGRLQIWNLTSCLTRSS